MSLLREFTNDENNNYSLLAYSIVDPVVDLAIPDFKEKEVSIRNILPIQE
jgi:hypothetical protein